MIEFKKGDVDASAVKPILLYPLPLENADVWRQFRSFAERFCATWKQFPPGIDLDLVALCCRNMALEQLKLFEGLPARFIQYEGNGADLGSHQWFARNCGGNPFLICCTSRMYFHRAGWGERLVQARQSYGPGLYGISCSHEGGHLHVCTRGYCLDASDLREYPLTVESRDQGVPFECGENSIYQWMTKERGRESFMVYWNGVFKREEWFTQPNTFRKGDQSNMLMWDKHTDLWANADDARRRELEQMATGETKHISSAKDGVLKVAATLPLKVDPEKSTLTQSLEDMYRVSDEIVVLLDNERTDVIPPTPPITEIMHISAPGPWNDWANRAALMVRAAKYGCRWIMQLDDDETLGESLTRERVLELCAMAERDGYVEICVRQRIIWESKLDGFEEDRWRKDGIWGQMPKSLFLYNPYILQEPRFRYGPDWTLHHFPALNGPIMQVEDYIYHWGLRTRSLREKNAAKYLAADPKQRFASVEYEKILEEEGMELKPI